MLGPDTWTEITVDHGHEPGPWRCLTGAGAPCGHIHETLLDAYRCLVTRGASAQIEQIPVTILSTSQAAERCGVTARTIRDWIKRDQLPARRIGRKWQIRSCDLPW